MDFNHFAVVIQNKTKIETERNDCSEIGSDVLSEYKYPMFMRFGYSETFF